MQPAVPQAQLAVPRKPSWSGPLLAFMGACTPGGFLFLIALLTDSAINLDEPVWYILAALGGAGGWWLSKRV